jgi:hypothetical protein
VIRKELKRGFAFIPPRNCYRGRRFAILEGGYYFSYVGQNARSLAEGLAAS